MLTDFVIGEQHLLTDMGKAVENVLEQFLAMPLSLVVRVDDDVL